MWAGGKFAGVVGCFLDTSIKEGLNQDVNIHGHWWAVNHFVIFMNFYKVWIVGKDKLLQNRVLSLSGKICADVLGR